MTIRRPVLALFDCVAPADSVAAALQACDDAGLAVDDARENDAAGLVTDADREFNVPYEDWHLAVSFYLDDDLGPEHPLVDVHLNRSMDPAEFDDTTAHGEWMDTAVGLLVRLAMALEATYAPLYWLEERADAMVPEGRPIADSVTALPPIGVYEPSVVEEFGGLDAMYDEPWYVAELEDGRTLVVESASPWSDAGWEPASDASYVSRVRRGPDA